MSDVCTAVLTGHYNYSVADDDTSLDFISRCRRKKSFFFGTQGPSVPLGYSAVSLEELFVHHLINVSI
jgi:hypothetical protein